MAVVTIHSLHLLVEGSGRSPRGRLAGGAASFFEARSMFF